MNLQGTSPITDMKMDTELKVRVIGFRQAKTFKWVLQGFKGANSFKGLFVAQKVKVVFQQFE